MGGNAGRRRIVVRHNDFDCLNLGAINKLQSLPEGEGGRTQASLRSLRKLGCVGGRVGTQQAQSVKIRGRSPTRSVSLRSTTLPFGEGFSNAPRKRALHCVRDTRAAGMIAHEQ